MEIHVFAEKLRSFKELAVHYVLIVMGILTAMGLEQCNESRHHVQQAAAAEKAIVAELRGNLKLLSRTIEQQQKSLVFLQAAETRLGEKTFVVPDLEGRAQAVVRDMEVSDADLSFNLASLRRTEWESAIASQTLQHMDRAKVVAFTRAYTAMLEVSSITRQLVSNSSTLEPVGVIDMYSRGESKDSLRFARAVRQFHQMMLLVNRNHVLLADALREALGDPAPAAAASAASR
jgi:hypothetical protein